MIGESHLIFPPDALPDPQAWKNKTVRLTWEDSATCRDRRTWWVKGSAIEEIEPSLISFRGHPVYLRP